MNGKKLSYALLILITLTLGMNTASAGVMINNTRVIFEQKYKNANVTLTNKTEGNYAVQVWVNGETDNPDEKSPFFTTPSIFRLDPGQEQIVKVLKLPGELPKDRESVFYFNAQEIPATDRNDTHNKLVMAIRTRIKLFYRPSNLGSTQEEASSKLQWSITNRAGSTWLKVNNTSPYFITLAEISVGNGSQKITVKEPDMVAPLSSQEYKLTKKITFDEQGVDFSVINDYGGISRYNSKLIK